MISTTTSLGTSSPRGYYIYRMTRTPEAIADAAIAGEVVCYRYMTTAARFFPPGGRHSSQPIAAHSTPA